MKAVILAGGFGTRLSEETNLIPKPMVQIGSRPILWHIMKSFSAHDVNEFVICCGYKGEKIKEFFRNYISHTSDVTIDMKNDKIEVHGSNCEPWKVTLIDTGQDTMTGGRLKRVTEFVKDEPFFFTYGDGLSDIDIKALKEFHVSHGKKATVTAVEPPGRWGVLNTEDNKVVSFSEKINADDSRINGGFFVLDPSVLSYIDDDSTIWERDPLEKLSSDGELMAYKHDGFWQAMDTLREKNLLEDLWDSNKAPWKKW